MNYRVPMKWTFNGFADVEADSADEAFEKANEGKFNDGVVLDEATPELVDWEVTGNAKLDD